MDLKELLDESCIAMDVALQQKSDVLDAMTENLYEAGIINDKTQFRQAVEYRESLSETGLEDGIAIPHGVHACVNRAAISYVRLKEPIEWESMDGKPIKHVFLLAIPESGDKTHIRMLSQLAMMLMQKESRTALNQIQTRQELYEIL